MDGAMARVEDTCRLCLVTPSGATPDKFAAALDDALAGGAVASLILTAASADGLAGLAEAAVPIAQAHGVAALIHNDTGLALKTGADGVHIDDHRSDIPALINALHPDSIAGVGNLTTRHDAMTVGETEPDYVLFGRLDGDTAAAIFPNALELAQWWAAFFEIPAIVMGGTDLASVRQAQEAGIEFVALRRAVWEHGGGPGAAVAAANRLLDQAQDTMP